MRADLIVEADGGSRGNPGIAGYGSLVRDAVTNVVLAERAAPLGKESNNVAEYTGLIEGLRAVVEHRPGADVLVRMDSKLVVEQMSGRWKIKHADMVRLAAQARELAADITDAGGSVTYEWIPRAKNKDADKLSNDGMDGLTVVRDQWGGMAAEPVTAPAGDTSGEQASLGEATVERVRPQTTRPDLGAPTRVVLVRHGVTDFTTSGKLDGRGGADPDLSAAGREQAGRVARALPDLVDDPVTVITSSLTRAQQTGAAIAERLGIEPEVDAAWDEQAFGDWDGLTFGEIRELNPAGLSALRHDPSYAAPAGETREALDVRVAEALERAVARGGTVVVVTHRIVIMSVLAKVLGLGMDAAWRLAAAPASLTGLEVWRDGNASVAFTNDTHHLR